MKREVLNVRVATRTKNELEEIVEALNEQDYDTNVSRTVEKALEDWISQMKRKLNLK